MNNEYILCAAVNYNGIIVSGFRHKDCNNTLRSFGVKESDIPDKPFQGFLTSNNRFISRAEAFLIAKSENQIIPKSPVKDFSECDLNSEDLY